MLKEIAVGVLIDETSEETKGLGGVRFIEKNPQLVQCLIKAYFKDEEVFTKVNEILAENSPKIRQMRVIEAIADRHAGNMTGTERLLKEKDDLLSLEREARRELEEEIKRLRGGDKECANSVTEIKPVPKSKEVLEVHSKEPEKVKPDSAEKETTDEPKVRQTPKTFAKLTGSIKG